MYFFKKLKVCWICLIKDKNLFKSCNCSKSYVHAECLRNWQVYNINNNIICYFCKELLPLLNEKYLSNIFYVELRLKDKVIKKYFDSKQEIITFVNTHISDETIIYNNIIIRYNNNKIILNNQYLNNILDKL